MAEEIAHRAETRLARAVRKAPFPFLRAIDDFNGLRRDSSPTIVSRTRWPRPLL
jgi:hypothetical protein